MTTTGEVLRLHFECIANIPIGSTLRVTGSILADDWTAADTAQSSSTAAATTTEGQSLASENLGLSEALSHQQHVYGYTVEMVTSPATYPLWKTRKPVVITVVAQQNVYHKYRYLTMTPGNDISLFQSSSDLVHTTSSGFLLGNPNKRVDSTQSFDSSSIVKRAKNLNVLEWENPWSANNTNSSSSNNVSESNMTSVDTSCNLPLAFRAIDLRSLNSKRPPDNWNNADDATYDEFKKMYWDQSNLNVLEEDPQLQEVTEVDDAPKQHLYLACFHLPVKVVRGNDKKEWLVTWSESLLAKSTGYSLDQYNVTWVGTLADFPEESLTETEKISLSETLAALNCLVVFFPLETIQNSYYGMCKQVLWPAFHNIDLLDLANSGWGDHDYHINRSNDGGDDDNVDEGAGVGVRQHPHVVDNIVSDWDQSRLEKWWAAYNHVNKTMAEFTAQKIKDEDANCKETIVWVHDYHLSLFPRMFHEASILKVKMIFFLHIPFPTSQIFRELEFGEVLLEGILHANCVGFHAFDHARHFLHACKRMLGADYGNSYLTGSGLMGVSYKGKFVVITMSNVSIEADLTSQQLKQVLMLPKDNIMESADENKVIIAGVDVAQRLSGVSMKLLAYERLLTDYPIWHEGHKICLIQYCMIPQNRQRDEGATLNDVRALVRRIKRTFGSHVIQYEELRGTSTLPVQDRLKLWLKTDIFMDTAVREGLNLYPLEFLYARKEGGKPPGVVIASEFSAVCSVLNGAIRVNPFDVQMTTARLDKALTMDMTERESRLQRDIGFIASCPSSKWARNVLRDLNEVVDRVTSEDQQYQSPTPTALSDAMTTSFGDVSFTHASPKEIRRAYNATSKRCIILDFNGTLVLKEPMGKYLKREILGSSGQKPPTRVMEALKELARDRKNTVFIVSGDTQENLDGAIGNLWGLGLAASNGACFSYPVEKHHDDTSSGAINDDEGDDEASCTTANEQRQWYAFEFGKEWDAVKKIALPILSKYTARTNGSTIKISDASIGWSYYSCDPEYGSLQAAHLLDELKSNLAAYDVRFVTLKGVIEVVPKRFNKGIMVKKLLREVASRNGGAGVDFVLCIGDDVSDEKMFTSVLSFISESGDDYTNVAPSPPVIPKTSSSNNNNNDSVGSSMRGVTNNNSHVIQEVPSLKYNHYDPMYAFTITVGKKPSQAAQYINDAREVEDILVSLTGGETSMRSRSWDYAESGGVNFFA